MYNTNKLIKMRKENKITLKDVDGGIIKEYRFE